MEHDAIEKAAQAFKDAAVHGERLTKEMQKATIRYRSVWFWFIILSGAELVTFLFLLGLLLHTLGHVKRVEALLVTMGASK